MTAVSWYPNRQGRRNLGGRGDRGRFLPPPEFGRSVGPIPTMGADHAHHITTQPPPSALECSYGPDR